MSGLPEGWAETTIEQIADFNPKHDPAVGPDEYVSFVPMPAVCEFDGEIVGAEVRTYSEVSRGYTHFRNGDVLFAKITPCMENGKAAIARSLTNGIGCGSTEFHIIRPSEAIDSNFLWRFLRQRSFRVDAESVMTGAVGQRRVPTNFLKARPFHLPPLPEQRRIVAKLEVLDASRKRARADLDLIPALVARAKQAILAKAFRQDGSEPGGWSKTALGDLMDDVRYGTAKKCDYGAGVTGVLRIPNVQKGAIDLSDLKHADFEPSELEKLALRKGDVLVIRSNGSVDLVGRCAVVTSVAAGLAFAGYLIRLRPKKGLLDPEFLGHFFATPETRRHLAYAAKSTSGVHNVNSEQLKALQVPVLPLTEQYEIVRRIESAFAKIDRIAAEAASASKLLDRLDQALLARAFRGELVPQDPTDEPAEKLLERIAAARPAGRPKRGRRKIEAERF